MSISDTDRVCLLDPNATKDEWDASISTNARSTMMAYSKTRLYNWYACIVAASCMILYGYDNCVFNAISSSQHWDDWFDGVVSNPNKSSTYASLNTSYTIGAIISGWFFVGPVADYAGRKVAIAFGSILVLIATFMQAFAPRGNLGVFMTGRVIIGIGHGFALSECHVAVASILLSDIPQAAGPTYINEIAPAETRGLLMTLWQMFYGVGAVLVYWIKYISGRNASKLGQWDWRMVFMFQLIVPITILSLLFTIPESPRWYIHKNNQVEKAEASLRRLCDTEEEVQMEIKLIRETMEQAKKHGNGGYKALWRDRSVRKRLILALSINGGQQLTGVAALSLYGTLIFKRFWSSEQIDLINATKATMSIFFTLNAMWTVDRFGRKFLFIAGAIGIGISMLTIASVGIGTTFYAKDPATGLLVPTNDKLNGTKSRSAAYAITSMFFLFDFFFAPSWGAVTWIWTSEIFPTSVRAQATGMASQTQNITQSILAQIFPLFLRRTGFACFFFFVAMNIFLALFVAFAIPETRRVPLEDMDRLFASKRSRHEDSMRDVHSQQEIIER